VVVAVGCAVGGGLSLANLPPVACCFTRCRMGSVLSAASSTAAATCAAERCRATGLVAVACDVISVVAEFMVSDAGTAVLPDWWQCSRSKRKCVCVCVCA
jgi:hypothetical protein